MNRFGVTDPCRKIAKHFGASQAFVDAMMEIKLYYRGIRKEYPHHVSLYYNGIEGGWVPHMGFALNAVVDDVLELAKK